MSTTEYMLRNLTYNELLRIVRSMLDDESRRTDEAWRLIVAELLQQLEVYQRDDESRRTDEAWSLIVAELLQQLEVYQRDGS